MTDARRNAVGEILASIALLSRQLRTGRSAPFGDRILSASQYEALFHIAHSPNGVTPGALASAMSVSRGAITQLVDALRETALVDDSPNPHDARSRILGLTPEARAEVEAFESAILDGISERFAPLSTAELQMLAGLLTRVERTE